MARRVVDDEVPYLDITIEEPQHRLVDSDVDAEEQCVHRFDTQLHGQADHLRRGKDHHYDQHHGCPAHDPDQLLHRSQLGSVLMHRRLGRHCEDRDADSDDPPMEAEKRHVLHSRDGVGANHRPKIVGGVPVLVDGGSGSCEKGQAEAADGLRCGGEDTHAHAILRPALRIALLVRDLQGTHAASEEEHCEERANCHTHAGADKRSLALREGALEEILVEDHAGVKAVHKEEDAGELQHRPHRRREGLGNLSSRRLGCVDGMADHHYQHIAQQANDVLACLGAWSAGEGINTNGALLRVLPAKEAHTCCRESFHKNQSCCTHHAGLRKERGHAVGRVQLQSPHPCSKEEHY
mmetsp:Transcript_132690/g.296804  ORF Transcript_132690/g.296804 Transcript_132690/m.296804 type:complete len:351 (-) Transcript_132690:1122-2174(-)